MAIYRDSWCSVLLCPFSLSSFVEITCLLLYLLLSDSVGCCYATTEYVLCLPCIAQLVDYESRSQSE